MSERKATMMRTGKTWVTVALAALLCGAADAGDLRFSVSGLQFSAPRVNPQTALTVTYNLAGSGFNVPGGLQRVQMEFLSGGDSAKTITLYPGEPGARKGANSVTFTPADLPPFGSYTVRVTAYGMGVTAPDYLAVSDPADPNLQFANGRGVDVNRVAGSPYLGRIYVTEGGGGPAASRTTVDGVYVLNPDQSPAFPQPKATSASLGALGPWAASANSPNRPVVDGDGRVYITDVSDVHSGVLVADPDLNTVSPYFAYPYPVGGSRDAAGVVRDSAGYALYGSTSSIWVEGTGATRTVVTTDEDLPPGTSIWKREVPAGATGLSVRPTLLATPGVADWVADVVRDSSGNTYAVSLAMDDARKFGPSGTPGSVLPPNNTGYYGLCIDEAADTILFGTNDGRVLKTGTAFTRASTLWNGAGQIVRDVALDADGWVYALNGTDRRLDILAVGDIVIGGATAESSQPLSVEPAPLPGDIAPVGADGLYTSEHGVRFGDGKVDVLDAIYALRVVTGLSPAP